MADMSTVAESNGYSVAETHVAKNYGNETGTLQCKIGCGFADAEVHAADSKERSASAKKLCLAVVLCLIFMSLEVAGGIKADSLVVLTDAAHLLSDVAGFAISLFTIWAFRMGGDTSSDLCALVSLQLIWLITSILVYEAIDRMIYSSGDVDGMLMFIVATLLLLSIFSWFLCLDMAMAMVTTTAMVTVTITGTVTGMIMGMTTGMRVMVIKTMRSTSLKLNIIMIIMSITMRMSTQGTWYFI